MVSAMKKRDNSVFIFSLLFLVTVLFGLWVVRYYSVHELPFGIYAMKDEGIVSLASFLALLIAITGFVLLLIKFGAINLWRFLYFIGIVVAMSVTLHIFFGILSVVMAVVFALLKIRTGDLYVHNISEILVYGGVVSVLVTMFNPITAFLLLILVSLYDVYSVYISKHMITLAKAQGSSGIMPGLAVSKGKDFSFLGGGDVAFPLLFAGVFISKPLTSLLIIFGVYLSLIFLLSQTEKGKYYPAMPILSVGGIAGALISMVFVI